MMIDIAKVYKTMLDVTAGDVETAGFDVRGLSEPKMKRIAESMATSAVMDAWWAALREACAEARLQKKEAAR